MGRPVANGSSDPGGITLRRWQAEALPVVIGALRAKKRPVVSAFMGSGKSVFLAALIAQSKEQPARGVVVAAPRANLIVQLAGTLRRVLGKGAVGCWYEGEKEGGRRVTVSTYQSLPTLAAAWQVAGRSPSLIVCDEVHGTEAEGVRAAIEGLEALAAGRWVSRVGLTATPFRSRSKESLSLWDEAVYRYTFADGCADGVVVPARVIGWNGRERAAEEVDQICVDMLKAAGVWPVLASARTIRDAEAFAFLLCGSDLPAAAVHSRLSAREVAERVEALKAGTLKVLVHVNMLAEGADFPWLRGLMLRRRVSAKVRFVQEVGRVLRAHPGKTEGVVFDPFDLMGELGLSHKESIGAIIDEVGGKTGGGGGGGEGSDPLAVAAMPLADWLAEVGAALAPWGLEVADPRADVRHLGVGMTRSAWQVGRPGPWRRERATEGQINALTSMVGYLRWWRGGDKAKERIRTWIKERRITGRGDAADLIGLLRWLREYSQPVRLEAQTYGWRRAMAAYQWPDVELPKAVPSLPV